MFYKAYTFYVYSELDIHTVYTVYVPRCLTLSFSNDVFKLQSGQAPGPNLH